MSKDSSILPVHGNKDSMNLNHLVLSNIMGSQYFKVALYEKKTFLEVVDEIYYQVCKNVISNDAMFIFNCRLSSVRLGKTS